MYCVLTGGYVEDFLEWNDLDAMLNELKYFYVGEEFFFQNVHCYLDGKYSFVDDPMIYDDWSRPDLGAPRLLQAEDKENFFSSGYLMLRKVGSGVSCSLFSELYRCDAIEE